MEFHGTSSGGGPHLLKIGKELLAEPCSIKRQWFMTQPTSFSSGGGTSGSWRETQKAGSPEPSCLSVKSDQSMGMPFNFRRGNVPTDLKRLRSRSDPPEISCLSVKSDQSMGMPFNFSRRNVPTVLNWRIDHLLREREQLISTCKRLEHAGNIRMKPGPRKYSCELTLDPNTVHTRLSLYELNRKVVGVTEQQSYPERFDCHPQVLCRERLTERCYWEAEWSGPVVIALTYKSITRKENSKEYAFGWNEKSWTLYCSDIGYFVRHNNKKTDIPPPFSSKRVGVYVDCPASTLSFYCVHPETHTLTHLHTFSTTFTEPLCAGFGVWVSDSSVRLCVK
ncbi:stonustoxin subunit beta-like [Pygocentrus nattereri]|uniref:stonustoxin subunit beta-like n=1 Tax=Pygocentrus nattereri TaxID=42514 RepID=UPI0008147711|nr:stonustoxin subunit beta-like [Pygocentrus nattereri]